MSAEFAARFVKRFGKAVAVEADLRRPTDRFSVAVLFGPSGCGKTTTLRCLAGLERPEEGRIAFDGAPWFDAGRRVFLTPQRRGVGYLFQEYALFQHLTVGGNVGYGLRGVPRGERRFVEYGLEAALSDAPQRLATEIAAWERQRNASGARIEWMFTTEKARAKMGRAYPKLSAKESKSL